VEVGDLLCLLVDRREFPMGVNWPGVGNRGRIGILAGLYEYVFIFTVLILK
jgi:hypothetical protein